MASTQDLMNLIGRMEGWGISNTLATKNNNPGNLVNVGQTGVVGTNGGFAVFATPEAGMNALQHQIELDASRGLSLREFIYKYAPPKENDTSNYLSFLTSGLGVGADTPLTDITGDGVKKNSPVTDFVSGFDDTPGIDLGSFDMSFNSGISTTEILIGVVIIGVAWYAS